MTVVGARPQLIKASAVSAAFREQDGVREFLVHTGQHFDANMSATFFSELDIPEPNLNLGIHSGPHGEMTGRMLAALERVVVAERPDVVLVYGDTNSTLAGSLAAAKLNVPVAHVEAGLRSFNRRMPEEINRVLTDHVSTWLFAPTLQAVHNLANEGIADAKVHNVGDVMYDVLLAHVQRAEARGGDTLDELALAGRPFVLATVHRAENTDDPIRLANIVEGLIAVAKDLVVVWPMHPRTRKVLEAAGLLQLLRKNVIVSPPLGYFGMLLLERRAVVIATDSGGVQKEAFFHRVPCVTLRDETEWIELIAIGWNRLVPPHSALSIRDAVLQAVGSVGTDAQPYGDGRASVRIAAELGLSSHRHNRGSSATA